LSRFFFRCCAMTSPVNSTRIGNTKIILFISFFIVSPHASIVPPMEFCAFPVAVTIPSGTIGVLTETRSEGVLP
jgi:hypothetical protein